MSKKKNILNRSRISVKGLRITPQRLAVLDALTELHNHPTADIIIQNVKKKYPNVAIGTVYKILETFVEKKLIKKVHTEKDVMQYDAILEPHHHIQISGTSTIEDYYDEELDDIIIKHLKSKKINNFKIEEIKLHIVGKYIRPKL